jgi:SpoVK/Ycf46/Vps4 family AAA+-type ATPase
LKCLGLLTRGDLLDKTASDFIGQVVGESAQKTNAILALAQGNVLLIDEAYGLNDQLYGKQALDTLVEKVSGQVSADIAIIMIGYEDQLREMFRKQNPGLSRRFDASHPIRFGDMSDEELLQKVAQRFRERKLLAPIEVKRAIVRQLAKERALPNFGNAGAVERAIEGIERKMAERLRTSSTPSSKEVTMSDLEGAADELMKDPAKALEKLADVGEFKTHLLNLGTRFQCLRSEGRSTTGLVTNYIFTGPPGTGKTTVARRMAEVLYGYGVLASPNTVVTSAGAERGSSTPHELSVEWGLFACGCVQMT